MPFGPSVRRYRWHVGVAVVVDHPWRQGRHRLPENLNLNLNLILIGSQKKTLEKKRNSEKKFEKKEKRSKKEKRGRCEPA